MKHFTYRVPNIKWKWVWQFKIRFKLATLGLIQNYFGKLEYNCAREISCQAVVKKVCMYTWILNVVTRIYYVYIIYINYISLIYIYIYIYIYLNLIKEFTSFLFYGTCYIRQAQLVQSKQKDRIHENKLMYRSAVYMWLLHSTIFVAKDC